MNSLMNSGRVTGATELDSIVSVLNLVRHSWIKLPIILVPEILARVISALWEHFGMCTIWCCGHSARWTFQHENILTWELFSLGKFRHMSISAHNILAWGHFGMGTFGLWTFPHISFVTKRREPQKGIFLHPYQRQKGSLTLYPSGASNDSVHRSPCSGRLWK